MSREDKPSDVAGHFPFHEFFALDLRSLALFRVCLAVLVLLDWIDRLPDLAIHYSDDGLAPRAIITGLVPFSVHLLSGSVWWQAFLAAVALGFGGMLLVGWRTPLAAFMSFFLLISVHARNPSLLQGGDQLLRAVLLWGVFLPLGACWSVDSCGEGRQAKEKSVLSFASFVLIGQLFIIYLFAAAWKWLPEWRGQGTAVLLAMQVDAFSTRLGKLMRESHALCYWLTQSSVWLETLGTALLLLPFHVGLQRLMAIFLFVTFHAGLALSLELSLFPWVACSIWLALLPSSFWDRLERHRVTPGMAGTRIVFDPENTRASWTAFAWRSFVLFGAGVVEPASGAMLARVRASGGWVEVGADGGERSGAEAARSLLRLSPMFWPLARVPGLAAALATLTGGPGVGGSPAAVAEPGWRPPSGPLAVAVLMLLFGYVLLFNLRSIGSEYMHPNPTGAQRKDEEKTATNRFFEEMIPLQFLQFGSTTGLEQGWGVFAPRPARMIGWYYAVGTLRDGTRVEMLRGTSPPETGLPVNYQATFRNGRWRKWELSLAADTTPYVSHGYALWAPRAWNARHEGGKRMTRLEIYYAKEHNLNPGDPAPPDQGERVLIGFWEDKR